MGWNGKTSGEVKGDFLDASGKAKGTSQTIIDAVTSYSFDGSFEGIPANLTSTGTLLVVAGSFGHDDFRFKTIERGVLTGYIAKKKVTAILSVTMTLDTFTEKIEGVLDGKNFSLSSSGHIPDLSGYQLYQNKGSYSVKIGGKTHKGKLDF